MIRGQSLALLHIAHDGGVEQQCEIVTGVFALLVQAFLAVSVICVLLYKRYAESPRRTLTIWFMDVSKQCFAMALQHLVNIGLALLFARKGAEAGECIWYITNFTITVICGLLILAGYMRLHTFLVKRYELTWLRSGEYGDPPRWPVWFVQMLLWCFVCCAEKFITASVVILPLHEQIDHVIKHVEAPFASSPRLELVLVMVVLPVLLNALFAWIVDNLIKDPDWKGH
uniref:Transmembrane protein 110 n=1 Tax=Alexandrium andersonii TaxID=327968 RepID=A0A7S2GXU9_9DINO|mmetsp:Transcript_65126/g.146366  ORF Transcript_65126/g.146366 Transcript_65126/m.146366 type:complete len:228 (+) Transcript_65126:117-800(+)